MPLSWCDSSMGGAVGLHRATVAVSCAVKNTQKYPNVFLDTFFSMFEYKIIGSCNPYFFKECKLNVNCTKFNLLKSTSSFIIKNKSQCPAKGQNSIPVWYCKYQLPVDFSVSFLDIAKSQLSIIFITTETLLHVLRNEGSSIRLLFRSVFLWPFSHLSSTSGFFVFFFLISWPYWMTDLRPCLLALLFVKILQSSEKKIVFFLTVFYKQIVQEKTDQKYFRDCSCMCVWNWLLCATINHIY